MRNQAASNMALGGIMAALAVVIMCLGGLIPVATFVCPMVCMILLGIVRVRTSDRVAWGWYGAVAILGFLLGPDKEAAAVFAFLGYYPIIKPKLDKLPFKWPVKIAYFNVVVLVMYWILLHIFGMAELVQEFSEMGFWMTALTLLLGNVTFLMLDRLLMPGLQFRRKHGK